MMGQQRTPHRVISGAEKLRKRIFALLHEKHIPDDERKILAGTCRADRKPSMSGMSTQELYAMLAALSPQTTAQIQSQKSKIEAKRLERLKQHKRVDGEKGLYAAERALHTMARDAEIYWGPEEWEIKLHQFIKHQTSSPEAPGGYDIFWDSLLFPRDLHHKCHQSLKKMILIAATNDPESEAHKPINERRRAADANGRMKDKG
jgi:hypothetical protein